jgi:glycine oxidase
LRAHRAWQADHGVAVSWLDRTAALDLEPGLNPEVRAALYYPNDHQLMPLALTRALARTAVDLGAMVREGAAVDRLLTAGDRVVGVAIGGERVHAGEVVIANGAWASSWSEALQTPIPVRPVRGQMVALRTIGTGLRHVVSSLEGYILTKADGTTYVGTTVEEAGYDARPTAAGIARLLALAPRLVPRLGDATFTAAWAGLRPGTADGRPLIGRLPGWQGVTLAAGHFRDGILLAPITGELVTDLLAGRRPRQPVDDFDPGRFLVRAA